MGRRKFLILLGGAMACRPLAAFGQPASAPKRIGVLRVGALPKDWTESFLKGLRDHGLVEGQGYVLDLGLAEHTARIPQALVGLLQRKVDVIVASGVPSVLPARDGAATTPVVFVYSGDPIAMGLVKSLARPGGNLTGVTIIDSAMTAKRFELLRLLQPGLAKAAIVLREHGPENDRYVEEAQRAGRSLALDVEVLTVRDVDDLVGALDRARDVRALVVVGDAQFTIERQRIAELALKHRLPTMFTHAAMVEAGGLMSYGPDYNDLYRQAAGQVYKILQGAKPADIPVEQPTRFEQIVNLRTARALGLGIPPVLIASTTNVIE